MSAENAAERALKGICDATFTGPAVVVSDSEITRRIPTRRAVTREKELRRLADVVGEVLTRIRTGGGIDSARGIVAATDLSNSITVTEGYPQLLQAVADRFRSGDNAWADTTAP